MTATRSIAPTLLVAIDISKHRHEVLIGMADVADARQAGMGRRIIGCPGDVSYSPKFGH